jgi:plastocyanin
MTRIRIALGLLCLLGLAWLPVQAENHDVRVVDNRFEPAELTIEAGDTVTWTNEGSNRHNVNADDDSFRCSEGCESEGGNGDPSRASWTVELTFDEPGEIPYHCDLHGSEGGVGMAGTITVKQSEDEGMPINFGHTGSWYKRAQDGQGFSLEVVPVEDGNDLLVAYWFTFAPAETAPRLSKQGVEDQRWYVAQGPIDGSTAALEVTRTTGGVFDDPTGVSQETIGTATFEFASCTEATISYSLDLDGDDMEETSGEINLTRLTPDVQCEEMTSTGG